MYIGKTPPRLHQLARLFQRVAGPVDCVGLITNRVRKRDVGWKPCVVSSPCPILRGVINTAISNSSLSCEVTSVPARA